jgi:hypothetical protein
MVSEHLLHAMMVEAAGVGLFTRTDSIQLIDF